MLGVTGGLDACAAFLVPPTWGSHTQGLSMNDNTQSSDQRTRLLLLGHIVGTPGARGARREAQVDVADLLQRHVTGDWGQLDDEDRETTERALITQQRILSAYVLSSTHVKVWAISEADRSTTTRLLPEEY